MSKTITITIDDSTCQAFAKTAGGQPLSLEIVADRLLQQFARNAPREIVSFMAAPQCGSDGNMWSEFGRAERLKERAAFAPELALSEAVRVVVATKRGV